MASNLTHAQCVFCTAIKIKIFVDPTDFDQNAQCNDKHSETLCGGYRANYSLVLGSNRCLPGCSNKSLSFLVAFATAGIALVFLIKRPLMV